MSRSYRGISPRTNLVYSVEDVCKLYSVHPNTVSNWVNNGLRPVDDRKPKLFRGAELGRFHIGEAAGKKLGLRFGEMLCVKCSSHVFPKPQTFHFRERKNGGIFSTALCPDCGAISCKLLSKTECDAIKEAQETNTSLKPSDEVKAAFPAGNVKSDNEKPRSWNSVNDRLIYAWQSYAGQYDRKTIDAHLCAIRSFEAFFPECRFESVTTDMAAAWRAELVACVGKGKGQGGLSRSTVRHRASQMRAFFDWLAKRPGCQHLSGLSDYLLLPRKFEGVGEVAKDKQFPSLQQAEAMLTALPSKTLKDRRDRAILALAFASGLREGALITLRMRHVMADQLQIKHDGTELKAKNGKSFVVDFFPKTDLFQDVFLNWYNEMTMIGLRPQDAVFPDAKGLQDRLRLSAPSRPVLEPMQTASAVDAVFKKASAAIGAAFTPHSVRHTLAKLGEELCRTAKKRKAWSMNLGHESENITLQNYGKMHATEKSDVLRLIDEGNADEGQITTLLLDYVTYKLIRGSDDFKTVEAMIEAHKKKLGAA